MAIYAKSADAKKVGRYAIYWVHLKERYRPRFNRLQAQHRADLDKAYLEKKSVQATQTEEKKETKKLEQIVRDSQDTLAKATSVFPFTMFPTTINLDLHKLTIKKRAFLQSGQVVSVPIENIKKVEVTMGPLFGSLVITSDNVANNIQTVSYLWRKDAEKMQKFIQGAIVAKKEDIDISKVPSHHLEKQLPQLGEGIE